MSPHLVEDTKAAGLIAKADMLTEYRLVEVRLLEDLYLRIRGDQEGRLEYCQCLIPALEKEAISLNHAFTVIPQAYETRRKSHTGNAFGRAYALSASQQWVLLDDLRLAAITLSRSGLGFPRLR